MKRKAQGISINTIVITAIALLVLVVLGTLLVTQTGIFVRELQTCQSIGGVCKEATTQPQGGCENTLDGFQQRTTRAVCVVPGTNERDFSQVCCIPGALTS